MGINMSASSDTDWLLFLTSIMSVVSMVTGSEYFIYIHIFS